MPNLVLYIAISLDGYIATTDGGVDWLSEMNAGDEDYGYDRFYAGIDALVMGSRTYEKVLTFGNWPYPDKPVYVMSQRELQPEDAGVTVTDANPAQLVAELEKLTYRRVWLVGGAATAASFQAANLITEYILSIMPVMLGDGIPLFPAVAAKSHMALTSSEPFNSGVVQLTYRARHEQPRTGAT